LRILLKHACKIKSFNLKELIEAQYSEIWLNSRILTYAHDVDIVERMANAVKEAFMALLKAAHSMGLSINQDKTKYIKDRKTNYTVTRNYLYPPFTSGTQYHRNVQ
jgi:hypothetical protein